MSVAGGRGRLVVAGRVGGFFRSLGRGQLAELWMDG